MGAAPLIVVLGLLFCGVVTWIALVAATFQPRRTLRKIAASVHWTERARHAFALRRLIRSSMIWMPLHMTVMMNFYTDVMSLTGFPRLLLTWPLPWVASVAGVWLAGIQLENELLRLSVPIRRWLTSLMYTGVFCCGHITLGAMVGAMLPARMQWMDMAFSAVVITALGAGLPRLRRVAAARGLLRPDPDAAHPTRSEPQREHAGQEVYRTYHPKALCTGFLGVAMVFTSRAGDILTAEERHALHEVWSMASGSVRATVRAQRVAMAIATAVTVWVAHMLLAHRSTGEWLLFVGLALVSLVYFHRYQREYLQVPLQRAVSLQRNKQVLATALRKLCEDNLDPVVPPDREQERVLEHVYKRLTDAGVQTDFAKPLPPVHYPALTWTAWGVLVALTGVAPIVFSLR
jgi:hypothetical protein